MRICHMIHYKYEFIEAVSNVTEIVGKYAENVGTTN